MILGASDGLVSTASLMLGVGAGMNVCLPQSASSMGREPCCMHIHRVV